MNLSLQECIGVLKRNQSLLSHSCQMPLHYPFERRWKQNSHLTLTMAGIMYRDSKEAWVLQMMEHPLHHHRIDIWEIGQSEIIPRRQASLLGSRHVQCLVCLKIYVREEMSKGTNSYPAIVPYLGLYCVMQGPMPVWPHGSAGNMESNYSL